MFKRRILKLKQHLKRAQLADELGFADLWLRDVPFNVPSFGDAGQTYDPFVYLGLLAARTTRISLGAASIILPLRHPAHVAKAAATVDVLSDGRLLLGVASGDRSVEYPALDVPFEERGERFRESYDYIRRMDETAPVIENAYGQLAGDIDMLPKPTGARIPLLITGGSRQDPEWVARHADAWMTYPRNITQQSQVVGEWQRRLQTIGAPAKPVMQSLYVDLTEDPSTPPRPIHLGFRSGVNHLRSHLESLQGIGINHVALNLRFNQANIDETLKRLADDVLPTFSLKTE